MNRIKRSQLNDYAFSLFRASNHLIPKGSKDWTTFLCGVSTDDYVEQDTPYVEEIQRAAEWIKGAEHVLIGAGAGISTAAGLVYGGKRFEENFAEFIKLYGKENMPDMYAAGFYPFPSAEAKWGYWSKHALFNRFLPPALSLYTELADVVRGKDYFVLTTNVDHQFEKSGFDGKRIFATQGDYGEIQCERGCHNRVYQAEKLFYEMDKQRKNCLIPKGLVPKCPVCRGDMTMHLRCDDYFVEDEAWHECADRYVEFLEKSKGEKVVLLELGVGFNTPIIIRLPFEKMARENENCRLIRLNKDEFFVPQCLGERALGIGGDMKRAVSDLRSLIV